MFGCNQYINTIAVKTKKGSGASGGGEDRRLKKNIEFLIAYGGRYFNGFNDVYNEIGLEKYLEMMKLEEKVLSIFSSIQNRRKGIFPNYKRWFRK